MVLRVALLKHHGITGRDYKKGQVLLLKPGQGFWELGRAAHLEPTTQTKFRCS